MATKTLLILVSKAPAACGEMYFQKRAKNQPDVHFLHGDPTGAFDLRLEGRDLD